MNKKQKDKGLMKAVKETAPIPADLQFYFPHHAESRGSYTLT